MHSRTSIANALAAAFAAGNLDAEALTVRGGKVLGARARWLRPLARRVAEAFAGKVRPRKEAIARFILGDRGFARAYAKHDLRVTGKGIRADMLPIEAVSGWGVPPICTIGELADWLTLTTGQLDWFTRPGWNRPRSRQDHYRYRTLTKRFGQVRIK